MKSLYPFLLLLSALVLSASTCKQKTARPGCYKGRLEIKGICMNYTLSFLDAPADATLAEAHWTDQQSGKAYSNVFGLGSPCGFPDNIKEGDEFYFELDPSPNRDCNVCMAWYPTPEKKLAIRVVENCE